MSSSPVSTSRFAAFPPRVGASVCVLRHGSRDPLPVLGGGGEWAVLSLVSWGQPPVWALSTLSRGVPSAAHDRLQGLPF